MKIIITGSEGFVGSHLRKVLEPYHEVIGIDIKGNPEIRHDITEPLPDINADAVVHLAAEISVQESLRNPEKFWKANVEGSRNVSELAKAYGMFTVFFSSAAVYGNYTRPVKETDELRPLSAYGETKKQAEKFFDGLIFRPFNIFGKGQNPEHRGVISIFMDNAKQGKPITVFGGRQVRDFIYIDDVTRAVKEGIEKRVKGTYNLGTGKGEKIIDVAEWVSRKFGSQIVVKPERDGEILHSVADISKLNKWFEVEYNLWTGLEKLA